MRLVLVESLSLGGQPVIAGPRPRRASRGERRQRQRRGPGRSRGGSQLREVETLPSRGELDKPRRRRPRRTRGWSDPTYVSDDIRIQARAGRRAAIVPVREGLWLVGDIDEAALQEFSTPKEAEPKVGFLPLLLGPLLMKAAANAMSPGGNDGADAPTLNKLFGRRRRRARQVIDAEFEDMTDDAEFGCRGRSCRRSW